ncbi:TetR/AcrR family transcriptional regulator [Chloroflexi bacterium TSY]|nr:TetR/AcrR family transcriptional regulator [Chloroflexi bacterium TSY]
MSASDQQLSPAERILKVATRLFYMQGYQATGINQIIREANVAKASFYEHFGSKEALGLAYLKQYQKNQRARQQHFIIEERTDPHERVPAIFDYLAEWLVETDYQGCGSINLVAQFPDAESDIRQQIANHKSFVRSFIHDLVKAIAPAEWDEADIASRADAIYVLYEGCVVESQIHRDLWPVHVAQTSAKRLLT